jgi:hypothetical protein
MAIPIPTRPNVRNCTHVKVTGQRCGSPALRGEFFCYFHTRVIKGVQLRVDMQLHSMALLEDSESIQLSLMHVVDGLLKGTLDPIRARLIIQALRIAARNAKSVHFEPYFEDEKQSMVREVPDYARQYLIEHPELGPPLSQLGAGVPAREAGASPCSADTPVRKAATRSRVNGEAQTAPQAEKQNSSEESATAEPAAKRRQIAAHGASRGSTKQSDPAPRERKKPERDTLEEEHELKRVQSAIAGAQRGNWRDLRTAFEAAGITQNYKIPS